MRTVAAFSCFLLIINSVSQSGSDSFNSEEDWVDPHPAWSDLAMDLDCKCPALERSPAAIQDALAFTYFRKFVNLLFQRKRLHFDEATRLYKRSVVFSLLTSQLDELENIRDARDLDVVLTNILETAQEAPLFNQGCSYTHKGTSVFALVKDIFKDFVALTNISEVRFMLFVAFSIILGYIVRKRYRFGIICIVLGGVFLFGYFHTYLECNRKLKVDAMIEVINSSQDPGSYDKMSWLTRMKNYMFGASTEGKQKEMLKKYSKLNMPFCRPDQVFLLYLNDMFLNQLEILLERVSQSMTKLSSGLSFPYNLIAPVFLVVLVGYIIKLTFKYVISPNAWASLLHKKPAVPVAHPIGANEPVRDSISGENLKILLNVLHASNVQQQEQNPQALPTVSGVQELMEPRQSSPTPSPKKEKGNVDETDESDGSSMSRSTIQEDGFTLVDDTL